MSWTLRFVVPAGASRSGGETDKGMIGSQGLRNSNDLNLARSARACEGLARPAFGTGSAHSDTRFGGGAVTRW